MTLQNKHGQSEPFSSPQALTQRGKPPTLEEVDTTPPFVSWTLSAIYTVTKIGYQVTV